MAKKRINQLPDPIGTVDLNTSYIAVDQYDATLDKYKTVRLEPSVITDDLNYVSKDGDTVDGNLILNGDITFNGDVTGIDLTQLPIPIDITVSASTLLINNNELEPGKYYRITDRENIVYRAMSTNILDAQYVIIRTIKNNYYSSSGTHKGVMRKGSTYNAGDTAIWGGRVWTKGSGSQTLTTLPTNILNPNTGGTITNWTIIEDTNNTYYQDMLIKVINNFVSNQCCVIGGNDNTIHTVFSTINQTLKSDFGNNNIFSNEVYDYILNNHINMIFKNNIIGSINNNSINGNINNNSNNGNIRNNSNNGSINSNSNAGSIINNNSNVGSINYNSNIGVIAYNSNTGVITYNSNIGHIDGNSNTGFITNNSNTSNIDSNSNTGEITNNSNIGYIFNNSNTGFINYNSNTGAIYFNSNTGMINYNSNIGSITNNSNRGNIYNNRNNGNIDNSKSNTGYNNNHIYSNLNNGQITVTFNANNIACYNNTNNGAIMKSTTVDILDTINNKY